MSAAPTKVVATYYTGSEHPSFTPLYIPSITRSYEVGGELDAATTAAVIAPVCAALKLILLVITVLRG